MMIFFGNSNNQYLLNSLFIKKVDSVGNCLSFSTRHWSKRQKWKFGKICIWYQWM